MAHVIQQLWHSICLSLDSQSAERANAELQAEIRSATNIQVKPAEPNRGKSFIDAGPVSDY